MKYLIVLDEMQKEKLKEHILTLEGMPIIRPILKPMFVDTNGYSIYLTQDYVDALTKLAEKIVIEDAVKKATDNLLTVPKFEMEDKPLCQAGSIFKLIDADELKQTVKEWFKDMLFYDVTPDEAANDFLGIIDRCKVHKTEYPSKGEKHGKTN